MKHQIMRILLISALASLVTLSGCYRPPAVRAPKAVVEYYVDFDWTGSSDGSPTQPFKTLSQSEWDSINASLANGSVTVYFSALKSDGVTQQSKTLYVQFRRTDTTSNRLTFDGYTFYHSSSGSWASNPDRDIEHAYLNGKVFRITGGPNSIDSSMAIGWTRGEGQDFVTNKGLSYCCIETHNAAADNEPGVGANWQLYWDQHGSGTNQWASGAKYRCYPKQNNVTIRGFEITGSRSVVTGDNLVWEYNYIHDTENIGPGLCAQYTSHPDGAPAQIIMRPSTNMTFRHFKIKNTFGEAFYIGAINPDAPAAFQAAHGNQHSHILIEDFVIEGAGINGGQGDSIDCKHGITYLTIRRGDISRFGNNGNGINLPMTATNVDQHNVIERNYIHDMRDDGTGAQFGIYAATDCATCTSLWGYNGYTIRNNIVANVRRGIQYTGDSTRPVVNGLVYNNTVYNSSVDPGLTVACDSGCEVKNNFVFGGTGDPGGSISPNCVSDYNAHDDYKPWISNSEGPHTIALSKADALASAVNAPGGDFHLTGQFIAGKGATLTSFSDDYDGVTRTVPWDIGAYAYKGGSPAPTSAPSSTPSSTVAATPTNTPKPTATASSTASATVAPTPEPTATAVPTATVQPTPGVLNPPDNLSARVVRGKDVELTWRDNSVDEIAFEVQRTEQVNGNCIDWPAGVSVAPNTTLYTDSSTSKKKTYCYRVRAVGRNSTQSDWSETVTARP